MQTQTGAWNIKIIITLCSLSRGERLNLKQNWMFPEIGSGNAKYCRHFSLLVSHRDDILLPHQEAECSHPPRMKLYERFLRWDKSSKLELSHALLLLLENNLFSTVPVCSLVWPYFLLQHLPQRPGGHLLFPISFLSVVSLSSEDGPFSHQRSLKIARNLISICHTMAGASLSTLLVDEE